VIDVCIPVAELDQEEQYARRGVGVRGHVGVVTPAAIFMLVAEQGLRRAHQGRSLRAGMGEVQADER